MEPALFRRFSNIALTHAGIRLAAGKEALVSARVHKRLRVLGMDCMRGYLNYLEQDASGDELVHFLDVISTNFTSFYRESDHFDQLTASVSEWLGQGREKLRIWSAASSTGEEPYSIAITMAEALSGRVVDWHVLATDISTRVLARAESGIYTDRVVAPVTKHLRHRHMSKVKASAPDTGDLWQVKPELKAHVTFARMNLSEVPFPMRGPFDMIFCRNVMIYFGVEVRQRLVGELERLVRPGGLLVVGHAETLTGLTTSFRLVRPSVYVR
jgi:chemotaxis protein methyltransferase CheR